VVQPDRKEKSVNAKINRITTSLKIGVKKPGDFLTAETSRAQLDYRSMIFTAAGIIFCKTSRAPKNWAK